MVVWADYVGWMKDRAEDVIALIAAANSPFIPHDRNDSLVSTEEQAIDRPGTSASGQGNGGTLPGASGVDIGAGTTEDVENTGDMRRVRFSDNVEVRPEDTEKNRAELTGDATGIAPLVESLA